MLQILEAEAPPKRRRGRVAGHLRRLLDRPARRRRHLPRRARRPLFPGRQQSRTVLQATVKVAVADLGFAELGGARSYNLLLTGEVLRGGQLFDRFRYKFDFPAVGGGRRLPAAGHPAAAAARRLPAGAQGRGPRRQALLPHRPDGDGAGGGGRGAAAGAADPETARMLAEANALLANGDTTVALLAPVGAGHARRQGALRRPGHRRPGGVRRLRARRPADPHQAGAAVERRARPRPPAAQPDLCAPPPPTPPATRWRATS